MEGRRELSRGERVARHRLTGERVALHRLTGLLTLIVCLVSMSREEMESILKSVLLALQLCLGFWQIGKLTPVGAVIQCTLGWLLLPLGWLLQPFGLSPAYVRLQHFQGRIFKTVRCHVTAPPEKPTIPTSTNDRLFAIQSSYLGIGFHIERKEGNKLFINGELSYYITDAISTSLLDLVREVPFTVFLKGSKEIWENGVTGGVMTLEEVLDSLILDNHAVKPLGNNWFLPVNLSVSEEKLLKLLNLVGLFLQTKEVNWLIPTFLSFTSAVLEFSTPLRVWLYAQINLLFCCAMHLICDQLHYSLRRQVYSFGYWVDNLKPCNDFEQRVLRQDMCAIIGGGAKAKKEGTTVVAWLDLQYNDTQRFNCGPIQIQCIYNHLMGICIIAADMIGVVYVLIGVVYVPCSNWDEFSKMTTFVSCMANHSSGSLKSYGPNNRVHVRGLRESIICYVNSGYPPLYKLELGHVVVNGHEINY